MEGLNDHQWKYLPLVRTSIENIMGILKVQMAGRLEVKQTMNRLYNGGLPIV